MDIPLEVFFGFIGVSAFLFILGIVRTPTIPVSVLASGMFILFIAVITDNIVMGQLVTQSNFSNSTNITTYTYTPNLFSMGNWVKVMISLVGVFIMLIGGLLLKED